MTRRLEDRTSYAAEMHRLNKAQTLATYIKDHYGATQQVMDLLPVQSYEWWGSVSKQALVNPPSAACIEAVIGLLAAERPHQHPEDVLEGLPQ